MPLTHSESLRDHEVFGEQLAEMRKTMEVKGDMDAVAYVDLALGFEKRHRVIIQTFGRYPHRNMVMERESMDEERDYLGLGVRRLGPRDERRPCLESGTRSLKLQDQKILSLHIKHPRGIQWNTSTGLHSQGSTRPRGANTAKMIPTRSALQSPPKNRADSSSHQ